MLSLTRGGESLKAESKGRKWEPKVGTKLRQSINGIKHAYIGMKFETHVEYCMYCVDSYRSKCNIVR